MVQQSTPVDRVANGKRQTAPIQHRIALPLCCSLHQACQKLERSARANSMGTHDVNRRRRYGSTGTTEANCVVAVLSPSPALSSGWLGSLFTPSSCHLFTSHWQKVPIALLCIYLCARSKNSLATVLLFQSLNINCQSSLLIFPSSLYIDTLAFARFSPSRWLEQSSVCWLWWASLLRAGHPMACCRGIKTRRPSL